MFPVSDQCILFTQCSEMSASMLWARMSMMNLHVMAEVIFVIISSVKDVCGKPPTERLFLDKYGKICLCLDEIVWKGMLENADKDRIRRLTRLKPPTEF
ncbi:hypothetical protein CK203_040647 [Vitis vinifera]|uniref:Coatomer subunit zeta n=1 Tax=Vitis vinifera TaxID=29760 RepID=A0A438HJ70_VITVI|nr:hypothetical protein CK203_080054 [Vitis vinifera]RVW84439.1 hypothetical protein CK203_040647 [Vitis vinifera]